MPLLTKYASSVRRQAEVDVLLANHRRCELTLTIEGAVLIGHRRTNQGIECVFDTDTLASLTARTRHGSTLCRYENINPTRLDPRHFTITIGDHALTSGVCDRIGAWIFTPVTVSHMLGHNNGEETCMSVLTDHVADFEIVGL